MDTNNNAAERAPKYGLIYKRKLSSDELREVEERLDQMLTIAWAVFQTIAKEPAKLAELRQHLTERRKLDPLEERSKEKPSID